MLHRQNQPIPFAVTTNSMKDQNFSKKEETGELHCALRTSQTTGMLSDS